MGVYYRRVFISQDYIFSVQHGNNLQLRQIFRNLGYGGSLSHNIVNLSYFRRNIALNKILISLELDRTVAADCLVVVARDRTVECIYAQIENPVIRIGVFKYDPVHRSQFVLCREILSGNEVLLVQITFAD